MMIILLFLLVVSLPRCQVELRKLNVHTKRDEMKRKDSSRAKLKVEDVDVEFESSCCVRNWWE